ncbi:MAG TPA: glycosyltransferase, partial [Candidatus Obscuribacterales bacterium]
MRILITNHTLSQLAGTELYVRDVAVALKARGVEVSAFSPELGPVATTLSEHGVFVTDDLAKITEAPDLIHGHHHMETAMAMMHFPQIPAIFVCHGWLPWEEAPLKHPRILQYVAVDLPSRDRLVKENGIPEQNVELILNWADLDRFALRKTPLPAKPAKALVFSNTLTVEDCGPLFAACKARGIELHYAGRKFDRMIAKPEDILPEYDVVFAIARSAIEALAVGCAVVLLDAQGVGPMV